MTISDWGRGVFRDFPYLCGCGPRFPALTRPGLDALHDWLATNGEAIYATRPWRTYGESLDTVRREQSDNGTAFHDAVYDGTPRDVVPDFRYTRRADTVYVIVRHVAAPSFLLRAFRPTDAVKAVESLDTRRPARWQLTAEGLRVTPDVHPGRYPVYVLKVTLKGEG